MALINPAIPTIGVANATEDPDIRNGMITIRDEFNGNIDNANVKASAGVAHNKLANATAGQLLIANASGVITATAMSGAVTMNSSGVTTFGTLPADSVGATQIAADAVGSSEIAANAVGDSEVDAANPITGAKLDTTDGRLKQTVDIKSASADLTATTTYADIAGATATFTPDVLCYAVVFATFAFRITSVGLNEVADARGTLVVDGTPQTVEAKFRIGETNSGTAEDHTATVAAIYRVPLVAASHTLKLQAKKFETGTTVVTVEQVHTQFMYELIAS